MPTPLSDVEIKDFRARLCVEAERQFSDKGVDRVTMRSLTKALGCSPTTPYRYFKDKDAILAAVRVAILNRIYDSLEATRDDDAVKWTQMHMKTFVDFAFNEPEAYRLVFDLYQRDVRDYPDLVKAEERALKSNYQYVQKLIEEGYLTGDGEELGYMFFAQLHGLIVLRMTGRPPSSREQFDEKCRRYFSWITNGVRPKVKSTKSTMPGKSAEPSRKRRSPKAIT
jgi:AcrR family transcriptional regulator